MIVLNIICFIFEEQDCPRLPEGVSVPLILPGKELSQIFFDIRMDDALLWNNVNILHDDTFGSLIINYSSFSLSLFLSSSLVCHFLASPIKTCFSF